MLACVHNTVKLKNFRYMNKKRLLLFTIVLLSLDYYAKAQTDSIKNYKLNEVVVDGTRNYAIADGVVYIPSKEAKQHAININDLLARMMVAGLRVDLGSNKVETTYQGEVHFYIDGVEAQDWEVKALRPKDVLHVEYLKSPADPKYKNYQAVVNLVMKKYKYGGYVLGEVNQSFVYNSGNYGAAAKVNTGKWTLTGLAEAYYHNADDITHNTGTQYIFSRDNIIDKLTEETQREHTKMFTTAVNARYISDKLTFTASAGYRYESTPVNNSDINITYTGNNAPDNGKALTEASSKGMLPYINTYFQLSKLPRNSMLYGAASFSYNHNDASTLYTFGSPIFNATEEDVYLPDVWMAYAFPLYKQNYMTVTAEYKSEIFNTLYTGTDNTRQKLINNYVYARVRYNHKFSDNWSASAQIEVPVNFYKVNYDSYDTKPYVNGFVVMNGRIGKKHSLYAYAQIMQMPITPSFYNTVVRQDNEIEGTKGNAGLKPQRYASALMSYAWMPINGFSLNADVMWEEIMHDIVPLWHAENGLMIKDIVNSGNYDIISASLTPSLSLAGGKLNMQAKLYYAHEMHSGIRNFSLNNYGLYPYVSYNMNKNFSVSAGYGKNFNKGFMRGGYGTTAQLSDNLKVNLQYTAGNFYAMLSVNSVLRKHGWVKSWFDSDNLHSSEYLSRPWDGRYVSLTMRYTLDFGRKTDHGNNARFEGSAKTSVLK